MPSLQLKTPIEIDRYYHIFNRGNNKENLFYNEENYKFFLRRYKHYLNDHADTYAFCLMPNHFHFLVKITSDDASAQFRKFFQSYALSVNRQLERSGSLFRKNFRRIVVEDDVYLKWLVFYIHFNPEKHQFVEDFRAYKFSSFAAFLDKGNTSIECDVVFEWFGGKDAFFNYHNFYYEEKRLEKYIIEI